MGVLKEVLAIYGYGYGNGYGYVKGDGDGYGYGYVKGDGEGCYDMRVNGLTVLKEVTDGSS